MQETFKSPFSYEAATELLNTLNCSAAIIQTNSQTFRLKRLGKIIEVKNLNGDSMFWLDNLDYLFQEKLTVKFISFDPNEAPVKRELTTFSNLDREMISCLSLSFMGVEFE